MPIFKASTFRGPHFGPLTDHQLAAFRQIIKPIHGRSSHERPKSSPLVIAIEGPPGVGKSHLAVGLALKTIAHGHRVYFLTLHDLVTKSRIARSKNRLDVMMNVLTRPALLVLDEIGYLPLEQQDATFLFEAVSKRYESQKSIILTSNKSFADWGDIFPDPILATALLDRLLHPATTLNIRGESYRLKHRRQAGLPTSPQNLGKGENQMPS